MHFDLKIISLSAFRIQLIDEKMRIDQLLVERGLAESRNRAQRLVMAGEVCVAGELVDKPSMQVAFDAQVTLSTTEICPRRRKIGSSPGPFLLKRQVGCVPMWERRRVDLPIACCKWRRQSLCH